jgi:hypothetical protein
MDDLFILICFALGLCSLFAFAGFIAHLAGVES